MSDIFGLNLQQAQSQLTRLRARLAEVEGALREIADQDPTELALDPEWSQRIARAALTAQEKRDGR